MERLTVIPPVDGKFPIATDEDGNEFEVKHFIGKKTKLLYETLGDGRFLVLTGKEATLKAELFTSVVNVMEETSGLHVEHRPMEEEGEYEMKVFNFKTGKEAGSISGFRCIVIFSQDGREIARIQCGIITGGD